VIFIEDDPVLVPTGIQLGAGKYKIPNIEAEAMPFVKPSEMTWRKSSFCQGGACAEVAREGDEVLLRSTRAPGDVVRLTVAEWQALVRGIEAREFDRT
jgi:Domain of unknown function (DUF397)